MGRRLPARPFRAFERLQNLGMEVRLSFGNDVDDDYRRTAAEVAGALVCERPAGGGPVLVDGLTSSMAARSCGPPKLRRT